METTGHARDKGLHKANTKSNLELMTQQRKQNNGHWTSASGQGIIVLLQQTTSHGPQQFEITNVTVTFVTKNLQLQTLLSYSSLP